MELLMIDLVCLMMSTSARGQKVIAGFGGSTSFEGSSFQMLTTGQVIVVNAGQLVHLECEFLTNKFNLFDNPIWWRKAQRSEETQVNMMANILEPFQPTGRFKVAFTNQKTSYKLTLSISEVSIEDSGNFTCEVNAPLNSVLGLVTHYLFVRVPVDDIYIVQDNTTDFLHYRQPTPLTYVENSSGGVLRCVALGGYPPPDVALRLGSRDVTAQFGLSYSTHVTGERGLRVMRYVTERWSHRFVAHAHDDGGQATCSASVSGLTTRTKSVLMTVYHAPLISCESNAVRPGDRNAFLRCGIKARPALTTVFWVIDDNGTTVSEGQVVKEHWTLTMYHGEGEVDVHLYMRQVTLESFRKYTVVAENTVAATSHAAFLRQKETTTAAPLTPTKEAPSRGSSIYYSSVDGARRGFYQIRRSRGDQAQAQRAIRPTTAPTFVFVAALVALYFPLVWPSSLSSNLELLNSNFVGI